MAAKRMQNPVERLKGAWPAVALAALVLFTAFVLLDTFVLSDVQQVAEAADLTSIVAAQENKDNLDNNVNSDDGTAGNAEGQSDAASKTSGEQGASAESSSGASHGKGGSHGAKRFGGPGGKPGARSGSDSTSASDSDLASASGSDSASAAGSTSASGSAAGSISASGSDATAASSTTGGTSAVVAGAASAASAGTQLGTYSDENMQITVSKLRAYDTDIYVADVQVSSAEYLKTALAQGAFGRNLKDTTSNMAQAAGAVLAINGDYYGFRDYGYVLRNGVLYRETAASGTDALVVYGDGSMAAVSQDAATAEKLKDSGAWQVFSFGPVLVEDGQIAVGSNDEVSQSMGSNPRTAIGMISPLHYVVVVSDGRTDDNEGLSLYELAQVLVDNGASFAYNLDGGGSTTMYFQGEVLNNPTSGNRDGERKVSDIVYFG